MKTSLLPRYGAHLKATNSLFLIDGFQRKLEALEIERDARFPPSHLISLEQFSLICLDFDRKAQEVADDVRGRVGRDLPELLIIQTILQAAKDRGRDYYRQNSVIPTDGPRGINDGEPYTKKRTECSCCFESVAPDEAIVCMAAKPHSFCRECLRRQAETMLGRSQFDIQCLSTDGCQQGFSVRERRKFLSAEQAKAMDRLEAEDSIRRANLDGLVSCPFCPYAAICSPPEASATFTCLNAACRLTSCRVCRLKAHPLASCEEARRQARGAGRQAIDEEMSKALIRSCNICPTRFVKGDGCNRMTCPSCGNRQCYVCSKNCKDYNHFGANRCPMFDDTEARHRIEVEGAEEKARRRLQMTLRD